jgi:DNA-binding transcriptional MerR regulator
MEHTLTIEQLAAQSGMTVRNIRSHQARGLLPPPEVRVRVGYYGPEHLERLRLIRDLQHQGFNLNGIKQLLDDEGQTGERIARFRAALAERTGEPAETLTLKEVARRIRVSREETPSVLARAERFGVLVPAGEDRYELRSPALLAVASEVVERGIPLAAALDAFEELEGHCEGVARAFVDLFMAQVWEPFQQAEMPPERWREVDEAIDRLLPLAQRALQAIFQRKMQEQILAAFGETGARPPAGSSTVGAGAAGGSP